MKNLATIIGAALLLVGCGASHQRAAAVAPTAIATPQPAAVVTPQGGASEAVRAAGAESRKVTIPKIRDVPASGVTIAAGATNSPRAESRKVIIPKIRDVPVRGVTTAASAASSPRVVIVPKIRNDPAGGVKTAAGVLPPGVPYASDTDPIRIVSFAISSTVFHPGDDVTGDVVTTSNAASVTAQVGSIRVAVPRTAPGKFHLSLQLPSMPLPPGAADLVISAIRKDGTTTTRSVSITVAL